MPRDKDLEENAKDDWLKIVKKHKKKQKGLPALSKLNTNAGNVEYNIAMFNMMQPNGNISVDASNGNVSTGESMCESIDLVEHIQPSKPYMMRNDGKVFSCGEYHPYIKPILDSNTELTIRNMFERHKDKLKWFYDHTNDLDTKLNIIIIINTVIDNSSEFSLDMDVLVDYRKLFYDDDMSSVSLFDLEALIELLNQKTNQEFCRFRTSDKYSDDSSSKDIYFRISSHGFNWFNAIWNFIYENKSLIETVTIEGDPQAGKDIIYKQNGKLIDHMPVEEFIRLSGNPIIEDVDLQQGYMLSEAYRKSNPYHWVLKNKSDYELFVNEHFSIKTHNTKLLEDKSLEEKVEFEYSNIPIEVVTRYGNPSGYYDVNFGNWLPDDGDTKEILVDWTYKVEKQTVIEYLQEEEDVLEFLHIDDETDDDTFYKKLEDNFDVLLVKFDEKLKEYFYDDAIEDAQENYDYNDNRYDDYDESLNTTNNHTETELDDKFDMSMRTLL